LQAFITKNTIGKPTPKTPNTMKYINRYYATTILSILLEACFYRNFIAAPESTADTNEDAKTGQQPQLEQKNA